MIVHKHACACGASWEVSSDHTLSASSPWEEMTAYVEQHAERGCFVSTRVVSEKIATVIEQADERGGTPVVQSYTAKCDECGFVMEISEEATRASRNPAQISDHAKMCDRGFPRHVYERALEINEEIARRLQDIHDEQRLRQKDEESMAKAWKSHLRDDLDDLIESINDD